MKSGKSIEIPFSKEDEKASRTSDEERKLDSKLKNKFPSISQSVFSVEDPIKSSFGDEKGESNKSKDTSKAEYKSDTGSVHSQKLQESLSQDEGSDQDSDSKRSSGLGQSGSSSLSNRSLDKSSSFIEEIPLTKSTYMSESDPQRSNSSDENSNSEQKASLKEQESSSESEQEGASVESSKSMGDFLSEKSEKTSSSSDEKGEDSKFKSVSKAESKSKSESSRSGQEASNEQLESIDENGNGLSDQSKKSEKNEDTGSVNSQKLQESLSQNDNLDQSNHSFVESEYMNVPKNSINNSNNSGQSGKLDQSEVLNQSKLDSLDQSSLVDLDIKIDPRNLMPKEVRDQLLKVLNSKKGKELKILKKKEEKENGYAEKILRNFLQKAETQDANFYKRFEELRNYFFRKDGKRKANTPKKNKLDGILEKYTDVVERLVNVLIEDNIDASSPIQEEVSGVKKLVPSTKKQLVKNSKKYKTPAQNKNT
ncbi:hypothetical protein [Holospora elegans]|nr:hypothetical protein [Holospora elegans]